MRIRTMKYGSALPFAVLSADHANAVALGVHAPPAEIGPQPLGRDGVEALAGEPADVVKAFPRVLLPLQPFDPLRFGFCNCICHKRFGPQKNPPPVGCTGGGYNCRFLNDS